LFISPVLGLLVGYVVMELVLFLVRGARPGINESFKRGQILTAIALALSYGTNDGQKTMGFIALGLVAARVFARFEIPLWLVVLSAAAIALGTWTGGWRLIRTLGGKFYKIRPIHGLTIQLSSALIILGAAILGGPVSTTQVVSSAILGVGSAERLSKVRWGMLRQILITWLTTIPASALLSALLVRLVRQWF
jgi:PiT family inorganic phosphate transporter